MRSWNGFVRYIFFHNYLIIAYISLYSADTEFNYRSLLKELKKGKRFGGGKNKAPSVDDFETAIVENCMEELK